MEGDVIEVMSGRDAYRDELSMLADNNKEIICMEADLGGENHPFKQKHPERFFNMGIAELASIDMAAGMAEAGFIPFFSTFAPFATIRAAESMKLAMGYMKKNIKVVAPYSGVSGGWFGTTHHCLEDIAIVQSFQDIRIACPFGEEETRRVIREAAFCKEPYYIRLSRNNSYESLPRDEKQSCKQILYDGSKVNNARICLVSVGEEATRLCHFIHHEYNFIAHIHLCYVDIGSLKNYVKELEQVSPNILIVEEHRMTGSVASTLSLLLHKSRVFTYCCDEKWPMYGGSSDDVLEYLGFGLEGLKTEITRILEDDI